MHVRGTIEGDGVFATAPNPHNTLGRCREELRERHMATKRGDARQLFCYRKPLAFCSALNKLQTNDVCGNNRCRS